VSAQLLARHDFRAACSERDFGTIFDLMRKYDGASQDRISSPVDGLSQSRVSRIVRGKDRITSLELIERVADSLHIPGSYLGLAPRHWEIGGDLFSNPQPLPEVQQSPSSTTDRTMALPAGLIVDLHEAKLRYDGAIYYAYQLRRLVNLGAEPVTRYPIRISVDRFPGDVERSSSLYRENPLRWESLQLAASCDGEPMNRRIKYDFDSFKEVWLCFENSEGRFPLYPEETATVEYSFQVSDAQWGQWFQRTIRVPTRSLSVQLDFPVELDPMVWGTETSLTAEALPFRTPIRSIESDGRRFFTWSKDGPPLHAEYRLQWKFRARPGNSSNPHD